MMKVVELYWRGPDESTKPYWLSDAENVCHQGRFWWLGNPLIHPDFKACDWIETAEGWAVADIEDMTPALYARPQHWSVPIAVTDARGRDWILPAMLTPDGVPTVAMVPKRVNGKWERVAVCHAQEAAIASAQHIRQNPDMSLDDMMEHFGPLFETAYFIDYDTMAVLGLADEVLVVHGLRHSAGKMTEAT